MISFENTVITKIQPPIVVHSEKGRRVQMNNRKFFGLSLCMSGQITYTMDGKSYISSQGCAVLLPQGSSYRLTGDREGLFPVINFSCTGLDCKEITVLPLQNPQAALQQFEALQQLFLGNKSSLKIFSCFYELLLQISSTKGQTTNLLELITKYIEDSIQDPSLSNTSLANQAGISEVYLRKLFVTHCGTTPKQYILRLRLDKARQLLLNAPYTVTAIAQECGFSSVYHFCRCFKQSTGKTPTQYALENKIYQI